MVSTKIVGVDKNNSCRYFRGMMTPAQCRAARGFVDISQDELAKAANVSLSTVRDFEKGRRNPIPLTLAAMEVALVALGVRFVSKDDSGTLGVLYAEPAKDAAANA